MTIASEPLFAGDSPLPVELDVLPPERQRRWTILLRLLLALPQLIVVWLLGIAATVVVIIGWFAALILGRLPDWCSEFLRSVAAYWVRVEAYVLLLVDAYPPFTFDTMPQEYPVRPWFPEPTPLNRLAVLFRLILGIPVLVVSDLLVAGWWTAGLILWLITLILGRQPGPLFEATAAVLRFHFRTMVYMSLLTPTYPWGIFGDRAPAMGMPAVPSAGPTRPLLVSTAGKVLLVVFLILGIIAQGTSSSVSSDDDSGDSSSEVTEASGR
ncbi:DUF4389 domain-containing protein [Nocardia transvalensis]|uniref:DUF4389 domain-containing protein n=1 Tax=Nocardia transvalensis TaxID=37333 RepID=UPI0018963ADA|nr:DUF4389 domain-containing protein [Nocardia transvalensis]MBF6331525.1 DUF4389 domain-containing protein [Nocardia transvalensis]